MRHCRYALFALAVLACAVLTICGCSSNDRNSSTTQQPATAPVTFLFDLLAAKGEVPSSVSRFDFYGFTDTNCKSSIYIQSVDKEKTLEGSQQTVIVNVPVEVVKIKIRYYDVNNKALAESTTETLSLKGGHPQMIVVKEAAPLQAFTVPITFVFDLMEANGGEIPAGVIHYGFFGYSDDGCETQVYSESVAKDAGQEGSQQEVTLNVPVEVVKIKICYYDKNETVVAESITETLDLNDGQEPLLLNIKESAPPQGATVALKFADDIVVPTITTKCQVNLFDDDDRKAVSAYTTAVDPEFWQDIIIANVPTNVAKIEIIWLDLNGISYGAHRITDIPKLAIGKTAVITVSGEAEMVTSGLHLNLRNVWNDNNLTEADVHITYKSECVTQDDRTVEGVLKGTDCTVEFEDLVGLNIEVLSVTLSNQITDVPFEWLDYETAQAVSEGQLTLDVSNNEFANGKFDADQTMLVANPRQFRNIDSHLSGRFRQSQNVDFAGSCGLTIDASGSVTAIDVTARYYSEGQGYRSLAASDSFTGSYDGGTYIVGSEEKHYVISGVVANSLTEGNTALFGQGLDCTFKNVTMDDTCHLKVTEAGFSASLAAKLGSSQQGSCSLYNCTSNAKITVIRDNYQDAHTGGLVAYCGDTSTPCNFIFKGCGFAGSVQAQQSSEIGLVGHAWAGSGSFQDCVNKGNLTGHGRVGGIVGWLGQVGTTTSMVTFNNCANYGNLVAPTNSCGGILGQSMNCHVTFVGCENTGSLQSGNSIGGIVGLVTDNTALTIKNCKCSGKYTTIFTGNQNIGGLAGNIKGDALNLSGEKPNVVDCTFDFADTCGYIGGIFGQVAKFEEDPTALQNILEGNVTVSEACYESINQDKDKCRGRYCGSPYINTLD